MSGIIGASETFTLEHLDKMRRSTLVFRLATHLLNHTLRDADERPKLHLFPQAQAIVSQWLNSGLLVCKGGTFPAQLAYLRDGEPRRYRPDYLVRLDDLGLLLLEVKGCRKTGGQIEAYNRSDSPSPDAHRVT